jgi:molecular chaperone GrpE (heat shock protein)
MMKHILHPQQQPGLFSTLMPLMLISLGVLVVALAALAFYLWRQKSQGEKKIQRMALYAEMLASHLYGHPAVKIDTRERDALSIMASLNGLLRNLLERQNAAKQKVQREPEPVRRPAPMPIQKQVQPQGPSNRAKELIELRDRLLLAKPKEGRMVISAEVLDLFYQDVGELLAHEGITSLEETGGLYNQERQLIVDMQVTHNSAQDNVVCKTENPGYLFQGRLLRPQEVVIYKFEAAVRA